MRVHFPHIPPCSLKLALLALLWHALMPLWMSLPTQPGLMLEICSVVGKTSVFVSFEGAGKSSPEQDLAMRCPLCLAGAHLTLLPPVAQPPLLLAGLQHVAHAQPHSPFARSASGPPYLAHAPPSA